MCVCVCVCIKVSIERVIYYNLFCMYLYILHPTHRIFNFLSENKV